jgi:hypothetical protein
MNRDPEQSGDHLDAFLKAGDPIEPSALAGDGIESALDEIGAETTSRSRQATSRRTRRLSLSKPRAALLVGFATIGIGAAVAAGSQLGAHTGEFQPTPQEIAKASPEKAKILRSYLSMGGSGEWLDPAASDFEEVYLQLSSDIPFPKGYESWRDSHVKNLKEDVKNAKAAPESFTEKWGVVKIRVTSGGLRGAVAMSAFCAWVLDWRHADVTGDTGAAAKAAQVISEAPNWKAVTDEDPHPNPTVVRDMGFIQGTLFGWMLPLRDAVLAGDRARVEHLLVAGSYDRGRTCDAPDPDWFAIHGRHGRDSSWLNNVDEHYRQYLASRTS